MKAYAGSVFVLVVAVACVAVAACAGVLLVYVGTSAGERRIAALVETTTAASNGYRVQLEGFELSLPAVLSADVVRLASVDGDWLVAHDVFVSIDAPALLSGSVRAVDARIGEVFLSALPPGEAAEDDPQPLRWPREIDIASVSIRRGFVATALLEKLTSMLLQGDESSNIGPLVFEGAVRYGFADNRLDLEARAAASDLRGRGNATASWHALEPRVDVVLADLLGQASVRARVSTGAAGLGAARAESTTVSFDLRPIAIGIQRRRARGFHTEAALELRSPSVEGVGAGLFGERVALQASASLGPEIFPLELSSLTVRGGGFGADARASVRAGGELADAHVEIDVADVAPLGVPVHASMRVRGSASGDVFGDEGLATQADVDVRDIDWSQSGLADVVTAPLGSELSATVEAALRRGTDGDAIDIEARAVDVRLGVLRASSAGLAVRGPQRRIEGGFDVALAELAPWSEAIGRASKGAAALRFDLSGSIDAPQASAGLQVAPLLIEGLPLTAFSARTDAARLAMPASVRVHATAGTATTSVEAVGTLELSAEGGIGLDDAEIATAHNRIALSAEIAPGGDVARLFVDADLPRIGEIGELFGRSANGSARVELRHEPAAGRPSRLHATLSVVDLPWLEAAVHGVEIDAEGIYADAAGPAQASLGIAGLRYAGIELDRLDVTAKRHAGQWNAFCEIEDEEGAVDVSFALDVVGESEAAWRARARELSGVLGGLPASFSRDGVCERAADGNVRLDVGVHVGEGALDAQWTAGTERQFGSIDADEFPLRYLAPLLHPSLQLDGTISAEVFVPERLSPSATTDELPRASVVLTDARSRMHAEFPGFDLTLVARRAQRELRFSGDLTSALGGGLHTQGVVTADSVSAIPTSGIALDSPLEATLTGGLGEQAVAELAALADQSLRGRVEADVRVRGRVGAPVLDGALSFSDGHYDARLTAIELTDIHAELRASRSGHGELVVTAKDGDTGSVAARGDLDLSAGILDPALDVEIDLVRMRAARLDEAKVTLDGGLRFVARAPHMSLSGSVTASEIDLAIPERRPAGVVVLDVVERNVELLERVPRQPAASAAGPPLDLDLRVDVPGPAFVRGRDLTTEWRGGARVTGTTSAPRLDGKLELIRGDLTVLGARFEAAYGTIQFDPTPWTAPHISVRGDMRRAGVNVSVIVSGPLTDLSIDFRSDPPMPRDEILSFVLFGTSVGNLTTLQAVQLAAAVAAIARPGGGLNPMGWVRRSTGLDRVEVGKSEEYDETYVVSAGKYLKEGVYVSVEQPLGEGASEVAVELDVTKTITLHSSVGADASGSLGATWSYDY